MRCNKCGSEIPPQSTACPTCGASVSSYARKEIPALPTSKRKLGIWATVTGLGLVAIALVAFALTGRNSKVTNPTPVPGPRQPPVVGIPATPSPPQPGVLKTDVEKPPLDLKKLQKPQVPQEVLAYLEHVKRVEEYRRAMRVDLSPAFDMLKKVYGLQFEFEDESREEKEKDIQMGYSQYTRRWQQIVAYLNSVRPPAGCERLAGAYGEALGKYSAVMIKIQYALSKEDPTTLFALRGSAQAEVDTLLQQADMELGEVCEKFGIPKSFGISTDKGMDALLSPGL